MYSGLFLSLSFKNFELLMFYSVGDLNVDGRMILKWILNRVRGRGLFLSGGIL
jgi:hypothetical protein